MSSANVDATGFGRNAAIIVQRKHLEWKFRVVRHYADRVVIDVKSRLRLFNRNRPILIGNHPVQWTRRELFTEFNVRNIDFGKQFTDVSNSLTLSGESKGMNSKDATLSTSSAGSCNLHFPELTRHSSLFGFVAS